MVFALYNHGRLPLHYKSKQKGVHGERKRYGRGQNCKPMK